MPKEDLSSNGNFLDYDLQENHTWIFKNFTEPGEFIFNNFDPRILATLNTTFVVFGVWALLALKRTKKTPATAKFLSTGLLTFDTCAIGLFTGAKLISNVYVHHIIELHGVCSFQLAYLTVGVMSLERLIIFSSPMFYLKKKTVVKFKVIVYTIWAIFYLVFMCVRFVSCYLYYKDKNIFLLNTECALLTLPFFSMVTLFTVLVSGVCYIKIFCIVFSEFSVKGLRKHLKKTVRYRRNFKSTTIVFVYVVNIFITAIVYTLCITLVVPLKDMKLYRDLLNTANCIMNPILYVMWFQECRIEMLRMFLICCPCLASKVKKMRMSIYRVAT